MPCILEKQKDPTWFCWRNMRSRCERTYHPQYANYGGRGITVCDKWRQFPGFLEDMGARPDGLSLDRIDNNAGYSKENCRWATQAVQARNKRSSVHLMYHGQVFSQKDLPPVVGVSTITFMRGIGSLGWRAFRRRIYEWEGKGKTTSLLPVNLITKYR